MTVRKWVGRLNLEDPVRERGSFMVRVGFLWEKIIALENCIEAVKEMMKNKKHTRRLDYIRKNLGRYGEKLMKLLKSGKWVPKPYREKRIYDKNRKKWRNLKIPCLVDQAVHHAVMRMLIPMIQARNYFYSCGSIPEKGQKLATNCLKGWQKKKKHYKWIMNGDISKFYDHVRYEDVIAAFSRFIKDKRVIDIIWTILKSMGTTMVGLAIGFFPSPWFGNLVLSSLDRKIKSHPRIKYVRYIDDIRILCNSKRLIRKIKEEICEVLQGLCMQLKKDWQIYSGKNRPIHFLSYLFYRGYTVLRKGLMYRISRKAKHFNDTKVTLQKAMSFMSFKGILKYCNSYNFRKEKVYPYISSIKLRRLISHEAKNALFSET